MRRTRAALHRALIELMQDRHYDRITVQDIIDRADVGRSTFYAHYRDKDDLLLVSCTEHVRAVLSEELSRYRGAVPLLAPVAILFRLVGEHTEIYRPLIGQRANATVLRAVRQMYADLLADHLGPRLDLDPSDLDATVTFLSWGIFGLQEAVVDPHRSLTAEQAFAQFRALWAGAGHPL
ncbi:TetR/AcrR family transcriptional regulator [Nocardia huaxiensis]|uniref:TetR/AcrR family transcriptional regulator n=1 Tax=Nocardia huaxiensis TaxID=2755382 RepID=UPI001E5B0D98|nr:TetR/AcrR family transcriptional regulator [Nocardia huaxiensis]UFS95676.1 TetR/AcrR family transcriptional regulator [Nocardia huaxiensis]